MNMPIAELPFSYQLPILSNTNLKPILKPKSKWHLDTEASCKGC